MKLPKKFQKQADYLFIAAATSTATATEAPTIGLLPNQIVWNLSFIFITFHNLLYANFPITPENKELFDSF